MGSTLTNTQPKDTYKSLLKTSDSTELSATAKYVSDGNGNDSPLALSTSAVGIGTSSPATTLDVAGTLRVSSTTPTEEFFNTTNGDVWASIFSQASGTGSGASLVFSTKRDGNTATDKMIITQAGNVTIKSESNAGGGVLNLENTTTSVNGQDWGSVNFISNDSSTSASGIRASIVGTSTSFNGDGNIVFSTAPSNGVNTERMRILATGGLTFNGDTAAANALDDYEEGTFTPTVEGSSSAGTATYVVQSGRYTKIGNQISISIDLSWNSGTGTGALRIANLPFANIPNNNAASIGFIDQIALTAFNIATAYVAPSSSRIDFVQTPTGGGAVSDVTYDAAGRIIVAAVYYNS